MNAENLPLVDKIVTNCIETFTKLHKNGKPLKDEWTVLSCIVQHDKITSNASVVSLGTGTKCIGSSQMSSAGDLLNDSHAEVFARRGFLVYLYENMEKALNDKCSIFSFKDNKFRLKENIEFIFYSSQMPCGDASIIPKYDLEDAGTLLASNKRQAENDICDLEIKKRKCDVMDVHRTGAKCLSNSAQDLKFPGINYHICGQVRTKPGRGPPTLSVSCSDKIARWIHLGVQGGLMDMLLHEPLYLKCFIFGAGVPYSKHTLERAFFKRSESKILYMEHKPQICQTSVEFPHIRRETNTRASANSILFIELDKKVHEVAVLGRKHGLTKHKLSNPENSLCISKYHLYKRFHNILLHAKLKESLVATIDINTMAYNEMKRKSVKYIERWKDIKGSFFKIWTEKPDIFNFCISE